jgi:hypothetical protein
MNRPTRNTPCALLAFGVLAALCAPLVGCAGTDGQTDDEVKITFQKITYTIDDKATALDDAGQAPSVADRPEGDAPLGRRIH